VVAMSANELKPRVCLWRFALIFCISLHAYIYKMLQAQRNSHVTISSRHCLKRYKCSSFNGLAANYEAQWGTFDNKQFEALSNRAHLSHLFPLAHHLPIVSFAAQNVNPAALAMEFKR